MNCNGRALTRSVGGQLCPLRFKILDQLLPNLRPRRRFPAGRPPFQLFVDGLDERWPEELLVKGSQRVVHHFATDGHLVVIRQRLVLGEEEFAGLNLDCVQWYRGLEDGVVRRVRLPEVDHLVVAGVDAEQRRQVPEPKDVRMHDDLFALVPQLGKVSEIGRRVAADVQLELEIAKGVDRRIVGDELKNVALETAAAGRCQ